MDDYISKPINSMELQLVLSRWSPQEASGVQRSELPPPQEFADEHSTIVDFDQIQSDIVVDWEATYQLIGDDPGLIRDLVGMLRTQVPELLEEIRTAIQEQDSPRLQRAAHSLKGCVSYFGVRSVINTCERLERMEEAALWSEGAPLLELLEQQLDRMMQALDNEPVR